MRKSGWYHSPPPPTKRKKKKSTNREERVTGSEEEWRTNDCCSGMIFTYSIFSFRFGPPTILTYQSWSSAKNISFQLQPQAPNSLGSYTLRISSNGTNVNHPPYTFFTSSFSYPPCPVFLQRLHLLVAPHQQARQRNDGRSSFKRFTQFWDRGRRGDVYRGGGEDLGSQSRQFGMD